MTDLDSQLTILIAEAKLGDKEAFGEVFNLMAEPIFRFVSARLSDKEVAKDLVSQVFLEAWQSLPRYNSKRPFRPWLYSIARYRLIDHFRKHRPTVSLEAVMEKPGTTDIEGEVAREEQSNELLATLAQLPELYQTVIRLKYIEELDYAEIAQVTGKSENSLRVIVNRGLEKLRHQFSLNG